MSQTKTRGRELAARPVENRANKADLTKKGSSKRTSGTLRVSTTMPAQKVEELKDLVGEAGLSTVSDLLERALSFYKWLLQQRREGRSLYVRDPDGTFHAVITAM